MSNETKIKEYYTKSWLPRFIDGHNSISLAMHMGYFVDENTPNDQAKMDMNKFLVSHFPKNESGLVIVDAGCGVGGTCKFLVENYNDFHVFGINIHDEQILFAQQNIEQKASNSDVTFLNESYLSTSLENDSVDVFFAMESMCHAVDKDEFIREAFRVLKKGGVCLIFDYFLTKVDVKSFSFRNQALIRDFSVGWVVDSYPDLSFERRMYEIGFSNVDSISLTDNVFPGIEHSFNKAQKTISECPSESQVFLDHLKANIALKKLIDSKSIDYRMIKAYK